MGCCNSGKGTVNSFRHPTKCCFMLELNTGMLAIGITSLIFAVLAAVSAGISSLWLGWVLFVLMLVSSACAFVAWKKQKASASFACFWCFLILAAFSLGSCIWGIVIGVGGNAGGWGWFVWYLIQTLIYAHWSFVAKAHRTMCQEKLVEAEIEARDVSMEEGPIEQKPDEPYVEEAKEMPHVDVSGMDMKESPIA